MTDKLARTKRVRKEDPPPQVVPATIVAAFTRVEVASRTATLPTIGMPIMPEGFITTTGNLRR
jgi:hypothetical protein